MKIYTRGGDTGETSLLGGGRVRKDHERIEAYGTVDELNSFIGVARASWPGSSIDAELHRVQSDLFDIGARLAAPTASDHFPGVSASRIEELEHAIDAMEGNLEPLRNFILPGGTPAAGHLHVARTVARRAERLVVALHDPADLTNLTIQYLNRLSDYLFVAARLANSEAGERDVPWIAAKKRGGNGDGQAEV